MTIQVVLLNITLEVVFVKYILDIEDISTAVIGEPKKVRAYYEHDPVEEGCEPAYFVVEMIVTSKTARGKAENYFSFRATQSKKGCYFEGGYNLKSKKAWALSTKNGRPCSG